MEGHGSVLKRFCWKECEERTEKGEDGSQDTGAMKVPKVGVGDVGEVWGGLGERRTLAVCR